ncbi:hypothetical protein DAPPUDRAFT_332668 [Daphnia pulex]|uniref:Uncharacterized protein n=1 Tax=Daphnia pulex TaxID=6669 RepID=E9HQL1_DAPPU|nr:hypothetical protein DAPPUDRAFT_332668 [Daphnia pulex]|eukprot:EFX65969.1 hypothetical protein DAPPUDRAFT_332668 [Daphnia pulex]
MSVRRSPVRNEVQWRESTAAATPDPQPSSQQSSGRHFSTKICVTCNNDYTPTAYHQKYCSTCGRNPARRKSQALVDNTQNPPNADIHSDIDTQSDNQSDNVFGIYATGSTLSTPYQPSYFTIDPSANTKRGNVHFSPLDDAADDKRTRNDCHTEAELTKLPLQQLIGIILAQQSKMNKLIAKRNSSEDALYAEKMKTKDLEENFNKTSAELLQAKLCFAEDFLSTMKRPATYADAVKSKQPESPGPVTLIADLCNGELNVPELKAIEDLLGSRDGGPVAQSSFHRDGKLFITFGQQKEMDTAIHILNSAPNAKEVISATSLPKKLYLMIIRDVMTTNYSGPAEIIADLNCVDGNRCLKAHVTRANVIFTNKRSGKSLVKLLIDSRDARDEALSRGRIYSKSGASYATVAVNPEREIRRCYTAAATVILPQNEFWSSPPSDILNLKTTKISPNQPL